MKPGGRLPILLPAALAILLPGCLTFEGKRAIVPFFEIHDQPAAAAGPGKAAAGAAAEESEVRSREIVLRPLGSLELIGGERRRIKLLWPLGDFAWGGGETRHWVLPFFFWRNRPVPFGEGSDFDWMLFPFFYGGGDPREGVYFAVLPLGGRLLGLLGKDEIHFALFPLYWRSWEQGEVDSMHLVFPFFNRVRGGGRSGWRLWPFYGRYVAETSDGRPRYDRTFVLWPFFISGRSNLNSKRPTDLLFLFPFYGQSINPHTETRVYLWPFFHTARDVATGNKLYFGYLIPYRFTGGQFDLWPLFGWKYREVDEHFGGWDPRGIAAPGGKVGFLDRDSALAAFLSGETEPVVLDTRERLRWFAVWPLLRYDSSAGESWEKSKLWALPLFWRFHSLNRDTGKVASEWKVWPLFRYRWDEDRSSFYFPSPLWFRQENPFERLYARLWRLFLYQNDPARSGWELLYGVLSHRHEKAEGSRVTSILYGLLEWESRPQGPRFRILYLPWR